VNVFHLFWALSFETKPQEKGLGKVKTKQTPARVCVPDDAEPGEYVGHTSGWSRG
jgi:hypothetical protein